MGYSAEGDETVELGPVGGTQRAGMCALCRPLVMPLIFFFFFFESEFIYRSAYNLAQGRSRVCYVVCSGV